MTLVELLVVVVILGLLMALLMPAIGASREAARRGTCIHQQSEVAAALLVYEHRKGRFPGYVNDVFSMPGSWVVEILPELGRADVLHEWTKGTPISTPLELLFCPTDTPDNERLANLSYAVNCGLPDGVVSEIEGPKATAKIPSDWPANGIFHDRFTRGVAQSSVSVSMIVRCDGASTTLLLGENVAADTWLGLGWLTGKNVAVRGGNAGELQAGLLWCPLPPEQVPSQWRINGKAAGAADLATSAKQVEAVHVANPSAPPARSFARPSSRHPGGAVVALVDGHVRFLDEAIEYRVYAQLCSPDAAAVRQPGQATGTASAAVDVAYLGMLDMGLLDR
jgi:prepilin-type processing-associated H-X9-DG protein